MDSDRHYYSLDILKFILSVLIVFHHFQQSTSMGIDRIRFYGGVINFAYCVEFFFIISGFLAAKRLKKTSETAFPDYLKQKIGTLYPMPVFSVLCMLALNWMHFFTEGEWLTRQAPDIFKVLNSLLMTFASGVVDSGSGINNPLWYINVLMLCHMILWVIMRQCRKYGWNHIYPAMMMCAFGCACLNCELDLPLMNECTSRGYCAFFLGIVLYRLYEISNRRRLFCLSVGVLLICTMLLFVDYYSFYKYDFGALTFVVFPSILFTALALDRFADRRFLSRLGGISFAAYVWHPFCNALFRWMRENEGFNRIVTNADGIAVMALFTVAVLLLAVVMDGLFKKDLNVKMNRAFFWLFEKDEA